METSCRLGKRNRKESITGIKGRYFSGLFAKLVQEQNPVNLIAASFTTMYNYLLHLHTYLIIKQKQIADALSLHKTEEYTRFIILCEPRTGSTLLHTYLNYHLGIKSYGEVLREKVEQQKDISKEPVKSYVFTKHAKQLKAVGLKMFYSYYQNPPFDKAFAEVVAMKDVRVIHLIREDVLQQYVSLVIAKQTGEWSASKSGVGNTDTQITIDIEHLKQFGEEYYQKRRLIENFFAQHPTLTITYEQLKNETEAVLKDVQHFLGVKPKKLYTLLQKQNTRPMERVVQNYTEVRQIVEEMDSKMKVQ